MAQSITFRTWFWTGSSSIQVPRKFQALLRPGACAIAKFFKRIFLFGSPSCRY